MQKRRTQTERAELCAKQGHPAYIYMEICGKNGKPQVIFEGTDTKVRANKLLAFFVPNRRPAPVRKARAGD